MASILRGRPRRPAWLAGLLLVAFGAAGCGLSLQDLPKPGGISGASYPVKADFANVLNLPIQARVLIGSDQVGEVTAIGTSHFRAELTLTIRKSIRVPVGTTAQILFVDPLGDEFIELYPPAGTSHGPWLASGATLPERSTSSAPSIPDTLAALGTLLNGGGLNQLQTIITQLNAALDGHQTQIRSILSDLTATVDSLNANKANVDSALSGLAALSAQLAKGGTAIATGLDTIGPAVGVLASENADFSSLLTSATQLSDVATSVVNASGNSFVATIRQLYGVVNQMVGVEQQLGPTLTDLARFETSTKKIAPGNYLQLSLNGSAIVGQSTILGPNAVPSGGTSNSSANGTAVKTLLGAGLP